MYELFSELVSVLAKKELAISSAESCTGGMFAENLTAVPGASDVFNESIVTYSNAAKMRELKVKGETLNKYGAVSRQTAYEMASGICRHTGANIGVGITGIAGPGGGSDKKPVGTVFVGLNIRGDIRVYHLLIRGSRCDVRRETCRFAAKKLLDLI